MLIKISVEVTNSKGTVTGSKSIQITLDEVPEYHDLNEYTIKIAQATAASGETNPFLPVETIPFTNASLKVSEDKRTSLPTIISVCPSFFIILAKPLPISSADSNVKSVG